MRSIFSYLMTMIAGIFWLLRVIISVTYTLEIDFPLVPTNFVIEIVLLFVTIICIVLIIKRNIIGALAYLIAYGYYFGSDIIRGQASSSVLSMFISILGILIPLLIFIDIATNKNRNGNPKNKKTDWFYKNQEYDRDLDDRADKNQYKF